MAESRTVTADIRQIPPRADAAPDVSVENKRKRLFAGLGAIVALIVVVYGSWYALIGSHYISTDNAYVGADVAEVTPLISARVIAVNAIDTQAVKTGDILIVLDDADARIAVDEAEAELSRAIRLVKQSFANSDSLSARLKGRAAEIARARAMVDQARAAFTKAEVDLRRRQMLSASGAVSGEELTTAVNALASAQANRAAAEAELDQASSTRVSAVSDLAANDALVSGTTVETNPEVLSARARLNQARLNLERTIILSPLDGVVAQRQVQIGQRVAPGEQLMVVVPIAAAYVDANFKEGQLGKVKTGQAVELTSDLYGSGTVYHGRVAGFAGGTGAAFALIPAQNATGNWIKVVQRLPVRVTLDTVELTKHPLRVGLSMEATIDIATGG